MVDWLLGFCVSVVLRGLGVYLLVVWKIGFGVVLMSKLNVISGSGVVIGGFVFCLGVIVWEL